MPKCPEQRPRADPRSGRSLAREVAACEIPRARESDRRRARVERVSGLGAVSKASNRRIRGHRCRSGRASAGSIDSARRQRTLCRVERETAGGLRTPVTRWSLSIEIPSLVASASKARARRERLYLETACRPLLRQLHAELGEERGRGRRKRPQDIADDATSRPEVAFVTWRFVTLQREPPLTRILAYMPRAPSRQRTRRRSGWSRRSRRRNPPRPLLSPRDRPHHANPRW
jgi:hypothetical protein